MKNPFGISLEIGFDKNGRPHFYICRQRMRTIRPWIKDENGNWIIAPRGGFKFDIGFGRLRMPVPKFWKFIFWSRDYVKKEQATNPWNSNNYWFVLSLPFFIPYFFISCCYGAGARQPGFYIGFKTYRITDKLPCIECQLKRYMPDRNDAFIYWQDGDPILTWCNVKDIGKTYLCLTASMRDDLVD